VSKVSKFAPEFVSIRAHPRNLEKAKESTMPTSINSGTPLPVAQTPSGAGAAATPDIAPRGSGSKSTIRS